jgi:hypothetical protein
MQNYIDVNVSKRDYQTSDNLSRSKLCDLVVFGEILVPYISCRVYVIFMLTYNRWKAWTFFKTPIYRKILYTCMAA